MEISGINGHGALQQDKDVGSLFAVHGNGLDRHRDLFRDVRGGLTVDGLMIGVGKEEMLLVSEVCAKGLVELCRVQLFVFLIEVPEGSVVDGVGGHRRLAVPCEVSEVTAQGTRLDILILGGTRIPQLCLDGIVGGLLTPAYVLAGFRVWGRR